ncbi:bifunctional 2-polyprenyl-6-hydroxyphenol methylase/3-demethylubiquinol 3-O-methyltransferase UbiG [Thalassospira sp.]|uniref:class I SAM-dependent methyltransferase n=1 Tax=Thalassospira sp. TaxID=1912094 RepID=UPI002733466B|nr:class I SAM-dependent methyltransferase [Thalassospira sp.]
MSGHDSLFYGSVPDPVFAERIKMSSNKPRPAKPSKNRTRDQYETFPYPARNAGEEDSRLIVGSPGNWGEVVHYVFGGRDPSQDGIPLRILVAGGGTGDAGVMLAQQAQDRGVAAEIVYVDLSTASRAIAEARIARRGLDNVTFVTGSFVDLAAELGPFDYIDCCGVLHHLPDPDAGLRALAAALKPSGGMGLMVYGELGRIGVYHMQDMMNRLSAAAGGRKRLELGKEVFAGLPATNWLKRNPFVNDHIQGGDAGFYDLLLHQQDRAYRVDEVFDFVEQAGLRLQGFIEPMRYDPLTYASSPAIRKAVARLDFRGQAALAELMVGNLAKHIFYVVRADNPARPTVLDGNAVPYWGRIDGAVLTASIAKNNQVKVNLNGLSVTCPLPVGTAEIIAQIDGVRSIAQIRKSMQPVPDKKDFTARFDGIYRVLSGANLLFLRAGA